MRCKYETRGIVLSRSPLGEAHALVTILTKDLGLVRARAQSVRVHGAKLAPALITFAESDLVLVRGRAEWRVTGAILDTHWARRVHDRVSRHRAGRVTALLLRLAPADIGVVAHHTRDAALYPILAGFFRALASTPGSFHESLEILTVIRILATLGLDDGDVSHENGEYADHLLADVTDRRAHYIARINRGIAASGL